MTQTKDMTVKKIINEWDPQLLLLGGAPLDEYEVEIKQIIDQLEKTSDANHLANRIKQILDESFSDDHDWNACVRVAHIIWQELSSNH
ncbi:hypothetical protein JCM19037_3212 [Geomicrobium sp. JCM 19037]|uniref:DUF1871 family protein n=1 Tax=unclassified Geomicrobium TaxID=2628951 RepID=UPI00045F181D|nr:DUF1871 family protein [Geomicrobium sp. JCM 19037]GAK04768.1 hypothetical protein JCM19037_3212 [Geomicrobium sp. JCM 19037]